MTATAQERPTVFDEFGTDSGRQVAPAASQAETGWAADDRPPPKELNYLVSQPVAWLREVAQVYGGLRVRHLSDAVVIINTATAFTGHRIAADGVDLLHSYFNGTSQSQFYYSNDAGSSWSVQDLDDLGYATSGEHISCAIGPEYAIVVNTETGDGAGTSGLRWKYVPRRAGSSWSWYAAFYDTAIGAGGTTHAGRGVVLGQVNGRPAFGIALHTQEFAWSYADSVPSFQSVAIPAAASEGNDVAWGIDPATGIGYWVVGGDDGKAYYQNETNLGAAWSTSLVGGTSNAVESVVNNGRYWFAIRQDTPSTARVWRNDQLGTSWELLEHTREMVANPTGVWRLIADPISGTLILHDDGGTTSGVIYASTDNGVTWAPVLTKGTDVATMAATYPAFDAKTGKLWFLDRNAPSANDWSVRCSL